VSNLFSSFDALEPHDLALLESQLKQICRDRRLPPDGPEASKIARELVDWYLFGIKDPEQLTAMLEPLLED
jgi:hypothetical protein